MSDPVHEAEAKGKEFLEKAKAGTLDEGSLKWGLSAGAIVASVSLVFNYLSYAGFVTVTGLDLLRFGNASSLDSIRALCIPLSAFFALYLHFAEPNVKALKMETPGRSKLVFLIGMIAAVLGVLTCLDFMRVQLCLGNILGFVGLGLLAFVYFKLWQMSPAAPATTPPPSSTPPSSTPPAPPAA